MAATIDTLSKRKILMITANPSKSPITGAPAGFWYSEMTHAYWEFTQVGYEIEIRSPDGGDLVADKLSDPEDESGYSAYDVLSIGFKKSEAHSKLLKNTKSIDGVKVTDYDAIFLVGGQSPMFTFYENTKLHKLLADFYEAGKVTTVVCHATCILLKAKLSNGEFLVKGKTWTGFANSEEDFADSFVGSRIQPFRIEEEGKKMKDTNMIVSGMWKPFAVRDGNLITGQQQYSGAEAAKLMIEALGR